MQRINKKIISKKLHWVLIPLIIINQHYVAARTESFRRSFREYKVSHLNERIQIDGLLNEHAWQAAIFTEDFVVNANGSTPQMPTKAQMLWDDHHLYIAFRVTDNDIWATMQKHDDPLWKQEAIEVFLDPDGDGRNYIELQINAIGTIFDLLMDKAYNKGGRSNTDWTLEGLKVGINVNDSEKNWICEIAIPFRSLSALIKRCPPKYGDTWRINLYRIERDRLNDQSVEATAWNPTCSGDFHIPDKFGMIIFSR